VWRVSSLCSRDYEEAATLKLLQNFCQQCRVPVINSFRKRYIIGFKMYNMVLREQLLDILALIAEITHSNVSESIRDTSIIDEVGLPEAETRKYLNELQSLDLIRIDIRASGTADEKGRQYRMAGITKEGVKELASEDDIPR
jgi:predicted transcriptional regulator